MPETPNAENLRLVVDLYRRALVRANRIIAELRAEREAMKPYLQPRSARRR